MIIIPEDVEQMVKKLEKHEDEIDEPWALAQWMKKKGYKMPQKAEEESNEEQKIIDKFVSEDIGVIKPHYKTPSPKPSGGYKMTPKEEVETKLHLTPPKKAEEEKKPFSPKLVVPKLKIPRFKSEEKVSPSGAPGEMPKIQTKTDPFVKKKAEEEGTTGTRLPRSRYEQHKEKSFGFKPVDPRSFKDSGKSVYKSEEEEMVPVLKDMDKEGLIQLYQFMHWLSDKGVKHPEPEDTEKLEQLMNQFEVETFAREESMKEQSTSDKLSGEQMEKKPEFTAVPKEAGIVDTIKKVIDPKPDLKKENDVPPLTKKTMINTIRKEKTGV